MPKLSELRNTIKVNFIFAPTVEVEIFESLLVSEEQALEGKQDLERSFGMMEFLITKWNITDEAGAVLPINAESFKQLPIVEFTNLITKLTEHIKKKSAELLLASSKPSPEKEAQTN